MYQTSRPMDPVIATYQQTFMPFALVCMLLGVPISFLRSPKFSEFQHDIFENGLQINKLH